MTLAADLFAALEKCSLWLPSPAAPDHWFGEAGLVLTFRTGAYPHIDSPGSRYGILMEVEGVGPLDKLTVNIPDQPCAADEFFVKRDSAMGAPTRLREALLNSDLFVATERSPIAQGYVREYAEVWRFRRHKLGYFVTDPDHQQRLQERLRLGREDARVQDAARRLASRELQWAWGAPKSHSECLDALVRHYTNRFGGSP